LFDDQPLFQGRKYRLDNGSGEQTGADDHNTDDAAAALFATLDAEAAEEG
jgi:hypothetical protein